MKRSRRKNLRFIAFFWHCEGFVHLRLSPAPELRPKAGYPTTGELKHAICEYIHDYNHKRINLKPT
ncbi:IS3 family transposase [Kosakonia radicincitans]|uniref:IS3 family transposase n=1 Tax=Kosakonia radicincitans TaxID=283686 RepID=UPI0011607E03